MHIHIDKSGFPLVSRQGWPFFISLFPVSKFQFEQFLAAVGTHHGKYTDSWYRELIRLNPRCAWHQMREKPWQLYLTGLKLDDIQDFLKFLGSGYRLPEDDEWRALHGAANDLLSEKNSLMEAITQYGQSAPPVTQWMQNNLFPVTGKGVLERIIDGGKNRFIGRPHPSLHGNNWNPVDTRDMDNRQAIHKLAGFRVVLPKQNRF
jgi:hypothetical protein